jgi:glycerol-3-phosphate O-acyltransferase
MATLTLLALAGKILSWNYGRISMQFADPIDLPVYLAEHSISENSDRET